MSKKKKKKKKKQVAKDWTSNSKNLLHFFPRAFYVANVKIIAYREGNKTVYFKKKKKKNGSDTSSCLFSTSRAFPCYAATLSFPQMIAKRRKGCLHP